MGQLSGKGKSTHKSSELEVGQRRHLGAGEEEHNQIMPALSIFKVGILHYLCWTQFPESHYLLGYVTFILFCFSLEALYPSFQGCILMLFFFFLLHLFQT